MARPRKLSRLKNAPVFFSRRTLTFRRRFRNEIQAYYNKPFMPKEFVVVPEAGACWIGPDGAAWVCPIYADGEFDLDNIGPLDVENADEDCVKAVFAALKQ